MITPTQMYWLTMLDKICMGMGILLFLILIACIVMITQGLVLRASVKQWTWETDDIIAQRHETGKYFLKVAKNLIALWLVLLVGFTLTPSTKQMAAILIVPRIANSEKVQTVGNRIYDIAVEWMDTLKPAKEDAKQSQ